MQRLAYTSVFTWTAVGRRLRLVEAYLETGILSETAHPLARCAAW